jgi:hypothetical protein
MAPPAVRASFDAGPGASWTARALHEQLDPLFAKDPPEAGFVCDETLTAAPLPPP